MKQTITHTSGITISNDSTNKKMKFSTQYIKALFLALTSVFAMEIDAQIWVNPLTTGAPIATLYKGDKINPSASWYYNFEIGQATWNSSQVGIGKNTDGTTGWDYADAVWYQDGTGSNKRVRRDVGQFQFTSTGTWYVVGRAKANAGDAYTYADETTWTNNQAFSTTNASYWTVSDLEAPSNVTATATSSTSVQVSFTGWLGRRVVVYRRTSATTTPTLADGIAFGSQNGSMGTLVYNGFASNFTDAGLTSGQTYYYSVYSENYSYYSSGVTVSATPCTSPTAIISGDGSVCQGGPNQTITFTGANGSANYTFTYNLNGGSNQTVVSSGNSAIVSVSSATSGTNAYTLISVTDANGCAQSQSGSATVTINPVPTATISASGSTSICSGQTVELSVPSATGATYQWKLSGTNVGSNSNLYTASSSGQYTCTITLPTTCSSTSSATNVTVNANPTISVSSASLESSCGATVSSTASGASTYLWSNGGTSSTGSFTGAGTYSVTGTSSAGCTGTASVTVTNSSSTTSNAVTVHYYAIPSANISGGTTVCKNETNPNITLTATNTGAAPYTFVYNINGGNNLTVTTTGSNLSAMVSAPTTVAGTYVYTLVSINDAHCSQVLSGASTTVVVNDLPVALTLTGGSYCPTTSASGAITSSGSASGVSYQLWNADGEVANANISGNGSGLTWSGIVASTGYYAIGTNSSTGCISASSNLVDVTTTATNGTYVYYLDTDLDGFGTGTAVSGCSATTPSGYSINTGDCNNTNNAIYPTATEICGNNIDENCSGASDDIPTYYRTIGDGNWGDASTWEAACASGISYIAAAYAPPSYYTGTVNIRDTHDVTVPANGVVYQTGILDIDNGGTLTLTGNPANANPLNNNILPIAKLTATVNVVNDGTMNIGHQASFVESSQTAANSGSGNFNVNLILTGTNNGTAPNGRYWYIGSPMNNTQANTFFDVQSMVRLWSYNATNNSWATVINSSTNTGANLTTALTPGIGYLYRAGSNKSYTFTGTAANLNNNLTTATSFTGAGYKFVANPYTSYVDWKLVTRSGLNVSYWIRNSDNTAYEAFNATTSVSTSPSGQTTQFIPPMQGFYVYAFGTTGSLRIDNGDRVHSTNVLHAPLINQVVRLKLNNGVSSDYAVVYENELASNEFEETDTDKMFDYDFHQLYTLEGEHELSLNGLLNATAKGSVDMGIVVPKKGSYTIEASDLEIEEAVILEDKFNQTFQNLKLNPIYSFTTNAGTFNNRFVLHFTETETVGVGETESVADAVRVFNTSNKQVKVWVPSTEEYQGATVKVYDAIGNLIERKNMTSNELLLDLDIANGIYVVEVTGADSVFTKKIFIGK